MSIFVYFRIVSQNFSKMNEKHATYTEIKHPPAKKKMQKESEYFSPRTY